MAPMLAFSQDFKTYVRLADSLKSHSVPQAAVDTYDKAIDLASRQRTDQLDLQELKGDEQIINFAI